MLPLFEAHVTLLLSFVAMYTGLGPHLTTLGLKPSQTMLLRLVALPGIVAALLVGPLTRRWNLATIARTAVLIAAPGMLPPRLLDRTTLTRPTLRPVCRAPAADRTPSSDSPNRSGGDTGARERVLTAPGSRTPVGHLFWSDRHTALGSR
jgi:hypothetical protein